MAFEPEQLVNFFHKFHVSVEVTRYRGGLSIYLQPKRLPLARLVPVGARGDVVIVWWSHRDVWAAIGNFGGVVLPQHKALQYILDYGRGALAFELPGEPLRLREENKRHKRLLTQHGIVWEESAIPESSPASTKSTSVQTCFSIDDKISLFRRLFRGRDDI